MVLTACPTLIFSDNSALDHGLFALLRQVEGPPRITVLRTSSPSALSRPGYSAPTPPPQDNAGGEEEVVENILRRSPAMARTLSETIIIGRGPPRSFDSYDKERTARENHILALQRRIYEYERQQADGDAKIRDLEQKHKDAEGVLSRELAKRDEQLKRLTSEVEKLRDTAKNKIGDDGDDGNTRTARPNERPV